MIRLRVNYIIDILRALLTNTGSEVLRPPLPWPRIISTFVLIFSGRAYNLYVISRINAGITGLSPSSPRHDRGSGLEELLR